MKKINTNFGVMYIETLDNHEEEDRIKIYDSLERYCDYRSIDWLISLQRGNQTLEDVYNELVAHYVKFTRLDLIIPDIIFKTDNLYKMALYLATEGVIDLFNVGVALLNDDDKALETAVLENDFINKIGKWYFYVQ